MKYMLLVYMNENAMNGSEREQCYAESTALTQELHSRRLEKMHKKGPCAITNRLTACVPFQGALGSLRRDVRQSAHRVRDGLTTGRQQESFDALELASNVGEELGDQSSSG
jgi:hypothetical protein